MTCSTPRVGSQAIPSARRHPENPGLGATGENRATSFCRNGHEMQYVGISAADQTCWQCPVCDDVRLVSVGKD